MLHAINLQDHAGVQEAVEDSRHLLDLVLSVSPHFLRDARVPTGHSDLHEELLSRDDRTSKQVSMTPIIGSAGTPAG
jgi:hypothetical protein